jgi:hypothetical protein
MAHRWIPMLVLVLLVALPEAIFACPVCFDASAENRVAFLKTAIALSVLPLGLVGGTGLWLRKRWRELSGESDEDLG